MSIRFATALAALLVGCAPTTPPAPRAMGEEARIPFANRSGIRNFRADGNNAVWIQGPGRNWYYATLFGPCLGLSTALKIGFNNRGTSTLDRFGQIVVGRQSCQIRSLVTSYPPPRRGAAPAEGAEPQPSTQ